MSATLSSCANVASRAGLQAQASTARAARSTLQVEARVAIRFTRLGRHKSPFYRVIAVDSRAPRETEALEVLGWYNPSTKETQLKAPQIKAWLNKGAQASDSVNRLLKRAMIVLE